MVINVFIDQEHFLKVDKLLIFNYLLSKVYFNCYQNLLFSLEVYNDKYIHIITILAINVTFSSYHVFKGI